MKKFIFLVIGLLFVFETSFSLTFKRDGTVVKKDGTIIKDSDAARYQKALNDFNNGNEVKDWPTVKLGKSGKPKKKKGYFGEKMLIEGAPMFSIKNISLQGNLMKNIAKQNGFVDESILGLTLIVNATSDFVEEKEIEIDPLKNTYNDLFEAGIIGEDLSDFESLDDFFKKLEEEANQLSNIPKELILDPGSGNLINPITGEIWEGPLDGINIFDPILGIPINEIPNELVYDPISGEIMNPITGLPWEGPINGFDIIDGGTGELITGFPQIPTDEEIILPNPEDPIEISEPIDTPSVPFESPNNNLVDKSISKENLQKTLNNIQEIKSKILQQTNDQEDLLAMNSAMDESTKNAINSEVREKLFGSALQDTLASLKNDLEKQKDILKEVESIAQEAGFADSQQMAAELGLNAAEFANNNPEGPVDVDGVETDPGS